MSFSASRRPMAGSLRPEADETSNNMVACNAVQPMASAMGPRAQGTPGIQDQDVPAKRRSATEHEAGKSVSKVTFAEKTSRYSA